MTFTRWTHDATRTNFKRTDIEKLNEESRHRRAWQEEQDTKRLKRLNQDHLSERTGGRKV